MQQLSVTTLINYIKNKLDRDNNLSNICVIGEISGYNDHFSGHQYFRLKDEKSVIECVMFKGYASFLKFKPKNGDKVIVFGNVSVYEASGKLELFVNKMNLDGTGDLYRQFEELKNKLEKQGKFDQDHKKQLDKEYIEKVAVLVGDQSAAMSDIKKAFLRRWPLAQVDYYPVLVQGAGAPLDIINNLLKVDKMGYDAIILSRGGGSLEDLFCFNDENLVNTIYDLDTFIVSGVGHEQDFTLCDFVSDLRAATPTAAVEIITPNIDNVMDFIDDLESELIYNINDRLSKMMMKYDFIVERLVNYKNHFNNISLKIDNDINLINKSITHKIDNYYNNLNNYDNNMRFKLDLRLNNTSLHLKRLNTLLEAYSCNNVLNRGYTMVLQDNKLIKTTKQLKDKEFEVRFIDGSITAERK